MFKRLVVVSMLLASAPLLPTQAFAQAVHPQYVQAIDAALKTAQLSPAQRAEVVRLRNDGERMHNSGNHAGADVALKRAMAILKIR